MVDVRVAGKKESKRRDLDREDPGKCQARVWEEEKKRIGERVANKKVEDMLRWVEEVGWSIMNGAKEGERRRRVTITRGRGGWVIDYVIEDRDAWDTMGG
ncbi:hypothetical protein KM043_007955 [Ampulex compressa]|nr:hypothetical protein KM043_007955 [Ampulex compressa]